MSSKGARTSQRQGASADGTQAPGKAPERTSISEPEAVHSAAQDVVSHALVHDAQIYAERFGVELDEALDRLMFQEPAGKLGHQLEVNEADTFADLWIQHEAESRIIVMFTREGEETIVPYIAGGMLEDIVEVASAEATLEYLAIAQANANDIVTGLRFRLASGMNVFENQVELYNVDKTNLEAALKGKR